MDNDNALDGSPYMMGSEGGCGCGGVSGGSPISDDGGVSGFFSNAGSNLWHASGLGNMAKGVSAEVRGDPLDAVSHIAFGVMKLSIVLLIVALVLGHDLSHWSAITTLTLACVGAVTWAVLEVALGRRNNSMTQMGSMGATDTANAAADAAASILPGANSAQ